MCKGSGIAKGQGRKGKIQADLDKKEAILKLQLRQAEIEQERLELQAQRKVAAA